MNKDFVLFNLKEALESLESIVREIETDPEYEFGNYVVDMSHLYQHINTAWNARDASKESTDECSQENFDDWNEFPTEEEVLIFRG